MIEHLHININKERDFMMYCIVCMWLLTVRSFDAVADHCLQSIGKYTTNDCARRSVRQYVPTIYIVHIMLNKYIEIYVCVL